MDLGTIGGLVLGFAMIVMSILTSGGQMSSYLDLGSFLMVIVGSLAAMMVASPLSRVLGMVKYIMLTIRVPVYEKEKIIRELVGFSESARKEGLLSLDDRLDDVEDPFMKNGMRLVVDGTDPDVIKTVLYTDLSKIEDRHQIGIDFFDNWSKLAPAFGMIGTLAGLVAMMKNLSNSDAIGPFMALALITTMYGSIFANLVLMPIKMKLEDRNSEEVLIKEIMIEGILSIQSGDNPRILEQKLCTFLPPDQRDAILTEGAAE